LALAPHENSRRDGGQVSVSSSGRHLQKKNPWENPMTDLIAPRRCTATAIVFLCGATALPAIATASDRGLGTDAAAACAALSGAGTGATRIDAAALTEPKPLTVAESGPTPAARISPATPQFCRVLGHIDPTDPKAPPIRFQLNLPLPWNGRSVQYGGGGFNGVLITGLAAAGSAVR
jgi:feruloyl esterase